MYKLCTSVTLLCTHNGNWKATLTFEVYRPVCLQQRRRIGPICLNVCRENTALLTIADMDRNLSFHRNGFLSVHCESNSARLKLNMHKPLSVCCF